MERFIKEFEKSVQIMYALNITTFLIDESS